MNSRLFLAGLLFLFPSSVWSLGLQASGEIFFDQVSVGKTYQLSKRKNKFYRITNNSEAPVKISLAVVLPAQGEKIPEGYKLLPQREWLKFSESQFILEAGKEKTIDLKIRLPKNRELAGKQYFAFILAQSVSGSSNFSLGVELKSRVYITVSK